MSRDGLFKAYDVDVINNGGHSFDLSYAVLNRAMHHVDNVYKFPKLRVRGKIAKTNVASNTA